MLRPLFPDAYRPSAMPNPIYSNTWVQKGLPTWLRGKDSSFSAGDMGPWVRKMKIPWRRKWQPLHLRGNPMDTHYLEDTTVHFMEKPTGRGRALGPALEIPFQAMERLVCLLASTPCYSYAEGILPVRLGKNAQKLLWLGYIASCEEGSFCLHYSSSASHSTIQVSQQIYI